MRGVMQPYIALVATPHRTCATAEAVKDVHGTRDGMPCNIHFRSWRITAVQTLRCGILLCVVWLVAALYVAVMLDVYYVYYRYTICMVRSRRNPRKEGAIV